MSILSSFLSAPWDAAMPISEAFVQALNSQPFWASTVGDSELFPELRGTKEDPAITVYYRGAAMLRELRLVGDQIEGRTHVKYLPIGEPGFTEVRLSTGQGESGLVAEHLPAPIPFGDGGPVVLDRYKAQVRTQNQSAAREGRLVSQLCRAENLIVDQEISLVRVEAGPDRIDLAVAHWREPCVSLVEVKRLEDYRLYSPTGGMPEVVDQLERYRDALELHAEQLVERFRNAIEAKQQLGIGGRFENWPGLTQPIVVDPRVILAIGDCSRDEVQAIQNRQGVWSWLADESLNAFCDIVPFGATKQFFPK